MYIRTMCYDIGKGASGCRLFYELYGVQVVGGLKFRILDRIMMRP